MNFCEKLQKLRKGRNMSQEHLAYKLSVSRQAVSKWESGQGYPEVDKIIMISDIFGVSLDDLLKGDNNDFINSREVKLKDIFILLNSNFKKFPKHYQVLVWILILSILIILVFGALNLIYSTGTYFGRFLYYITH